MHPRAVPEDEAEAGIHSTLLALSPTLFHSDGDDFAFNNGFVRDVIMVA